MKKNKTVWGRMCCLALSFMFLFSVAGCGKPGKTAAHPEKIIRIGRQADSNTLDPMLVTDNTDIWIMNLMLEGLVKSSDDGKKVEPCLADSWDISSDYLTYTFHIKKGLKFSDGTPVTGQDWIYSLKRVRDSSESAWSDILSDVTDIQSPDDSTLILKLKTPSAALLSDLSLFSCVVMPKAYCEKVGPDGIADHPVGVGPFYLESWQKGAAVTFLKNPYYYDAADVVTDKIIFSVIPDDNTRIMQLQGKQIDVAINLPFNRVKDLSATKGITVKLIDSTECDYISICYKSPKLSNRDLRYALAYAIDRTAIIKAVFYDNARVNNTFISPAAPHYNPDVTPRDYNPEKAKALIAQSGIKNPAFEILVPAGNSLWLSVATMLQDMWKKVGVTATINQVDTAIMKDRRNKGNYDMVLSLLTSDISDTSELMGLICIADMANSMHTFWAGDMQQKAEKLVKAAATEMDETKRTRLYGEAMQIAQDDQYFIPLCNVPFAVAMSDSISGFIQSPLGCYNFKQLMKAD